jgi:hypothetical protein
MKRFIKQLLREELNVDADIQLYVDIIDGLEKNDPRRDKYIKILKDKYNYNYVEGNDEYFINNPNLNDIKSIEDFKNFNNYKKYAKEIFRLRKIPLQKSVEGVLPFNVVSKILEPFNIEVKEIKGDYNHAQASPSLIELPKIASIEVVLHELAHLFDYQNTKNMLAKKHTHTITTYGLSVGGEAFAENFSYYFLYPHFLEKHLPEVYHELDSEIPNDWKLLAKKLISSSKVK